MIFVFASVVIFIIVFGLLISFKINTDTNVDFKRSYITTTPEETIPPSSSNAKYQEMRYDFLRFAEFFLLLKRPFGMKNSLPWKDSDMVKGYVTNSTAGSTTTNSVNDFSQCKRSCEDDTNCNLWKYNSDDKQCIRYNIDSIDDFTKDPSSNDQIGYIFNPKDTWAVNDLSNLPKDKVLFQQIAEIVLKLESKNPELLKRAKSILSSSNVKYCYEEEITPDTSSLDLEYTTNKDNAIRYLENASLFFINIGETAEYDNKEEYAMIVARILKSIFQYEDDSLNLNDKIIFTEDKINSEDREKIKTYVDNLLGGSNLDHWNAYVFLKRWFMTNKNSNGYITKSELEQYFNTVSGTSDLETHTAFEYSKSETEKLCGSGAGQKVNKFFSDFDDGDSKISLSEMLKQKLADVGSLQISKHCF